MMIGFTETWPRRTARICGVLYLIAIITGVFAELFVRGSLVVSGDAAATARNITSSEELWRLGVAADVVGVFAYIAVTLLLYDLLKPVSRGVSLLAAFFSLVGCAIAGMSLLLSFAPLYWLSGAPYLAAMPMKELQAIAYTSIRLHGQGYLMSCAYFGIYCFLIGYLIVRSTFIPKTIGILMILAGVCWSITTFSNFTAPAFYRAYSDYLNIPCLLGEGGLTLWLLAFGVNPVRWQKQASLTVGAVS